MDVKSFVGIAAVGLNLLAFWPYIGDTLRGKTKPHMYSWLAWTLITGMLFAGQVAGRAGPGAWATGCTTALDLVVFILSIRRGTTDITRSDRMCLGGALAALIGWVLSDSLTLSIVLVTIVDTLAFVPTVRKTLKAPEGETFITYPISSLRCLLSVFAITQYSVITCLYPLAMLAIYS